MPNTYDRRQFLTHSAAAAGGIAMAGTVVDALVPAIASAAVGDNHTSTPTTGGTLTVGIISEQSSIVHFNGQQGKLDASGFCLAQACYDPLFVASADGTTWLPNLALSATPDRTYTQWTIKLRSGVTFHNGDAFNADTVVANYNSANSNYTLNGATTFNAVKFAIGPLIKSVTKVDSSTVLYTTQLPWTTFPFQLADTQIAYMAHPSSIDANGGTPIGTGPFALGTFNGSGVFTPNANDWDLQLAGGGTSTWHKNPNYWKKDAAGRSLPYLSQIKFKVLADSNSRYNALQGGTIDLMVTTDGATIASIKQSSFQWRTDENDPRDPAVNCIIMNTQQGFKPLSGPGAVDPVTGNWDSSRKSVVANSNIRLACAYAINRAAYLATVDHGIGAVADGIYRTKSKYYKNPKYPAYSTTKAKAAVAKAKTQLGISGRPSFVIDILNTTVAQDNFTVIQSMLSAVGIDVTARQLDQSALIQKKIDGKYDASTWQQFGGITPDNNFVWFNSSKSFGAQSPNFVNFAQQADPVIESSMEAGMKATTTAARAAAWAKVNTQMAIDLPYLFLDSTVNCWAAKSNVRNFAYAAGPAQGSTGVSGTAQSFSPNGGSAHWEYIWLA